MDISKIDLEKLFSMYSIVFQNVKLFNNSIIENIRLGKKDATDEEVYEAARLANCLEFVEKFLFSIIFPHFSFESYILPNFL